MDYESNYRPVRYAYDDELMHYGVKGMKWGRRKSPTAYGGSITKNGKYRASNGVVIGRSKNKSAAIGRRLSVTAGGRALAAIGSTGLSAKQKARMKNEQAALREYYKVGGDKMLKRTSAEKAQASNATKKAYKQTDEYKAKRANVVKVGVAVAGAALAAYGAKKLHDAVRDKNFKYRMNQGTKTIDEYIKSQRNRGVSSDPNIRRARAAFEDKYFKQVIDSAASQARKDSFGTAVRNVITDYRDKRR